MTIPVNLIWFRQDLRLTDNPALLAAASNGKLLPVYILDDVDAGAWATGAASRWWLHHSLKSLDQSLGGRLLVLKGSAQDLIARLVKQHRVNAVYWNRCYEPWRLQQESRIRQQLNRDEVRVETFKGSLLWEPWEILKQDKTPYRVFTPYYKNGCRAKPEPGLPLSAPAHLSFANTPTDSSKLDTFELIPTVNWYQGLAKTWIPGEHSAAKTLETFFENGLPQYQTGRDFPALAAVSRLSPYLHHGEISPCQIWHATRHAVSGARLEQQEEHFQRQLIWREFSYYLLYHFPQLPDANLQIRFNQFPWRDDAELFQRWSRGLTGYPIVDAGMRELWQTGYMHNRVRMIVASFLVKNLMIHWRKGQQWFWDCLVDADLANNSAGWQWVAGCGVDAAPYFRIFNPVTQSQKFDPSGSYIRKFLPEIARLSDRLVHDPGSAPEKALLAAGIVLDRDYPRPIVDLPTSRKQALDAFGSMGKI